MSIRVRENLGENKVIFVRGHHSKNVCNKTLKTVVSYWTSSDSPALFQPVLFHLVLNENDPGQEDELLHTQHNLDPAPCQLHHSHPLLCFQAKCYIQGLKEEPERVRVGHVKQSITGFPTSSPNAFPFPMSVTY